MRLMKQLYSGQTVCVFNETRPVQKPVSRFMREGG